ncbi:hypothetical protein FRC10_006174 [Ceratobasidium sp. 414]|nr:hypothetical protein FRC10_006174 [Ceratobasidium sp. 414]
MRFTTTTLALVSSLHALAVPVERDSTVTPITAATIASFAPYANFVAAAYCSGTADWSCTACKKVPGFIPYATGGDGDSIPMWYVGWWPAGSSVVVVHEGTDPTQFLSLLTDAEALFGSLDPSLFPGLPSSISVHSGFRDAHASTAATVLTTVKEIIAARGATKVTVTGHSLGGAIAGLDAAFLKSNLPSTISIKAVTYGQPRIGNQDFADWIDQNIFDYSRITNMDDDIPIVPGKFILGVPTRTEDITTQAARSTSNLPGFGMLVPDKTTPAPTAPQGQSQTSSMAISLTTSDRTRAFGLALFTAERVKVRLGLGWADRS